MSEEYNCQDCQKSLRVSYIVNESTDYEYCSLSKNWNGFRTTTHKKICLDCWNKNQAQYKQEWEDIAKTKEHWGRGGSCSHHFDDIQAQCREKGCHKKFDSQTAESLKHKWKENEGLTFREHEELNKNPSPANTMEDLVQQWMGSMEYQKIFFDGGVMKIKTKNGRILEKAGINMPGSWDSKLEDWLKEQPNKEVINSSISGEREREYMQSKLFVPIVTERKIYLKLATCHL